MGYFSQNTAENEAKLRKQQLEQRQQEYRDMGWVTQKLFYIMVGTVILGIINGICQVAGASSAQTIIVLIAAALNFIYGFLIIAMPHAEDRFRSAGICFIIAEVGNLLGLAGGDLALVGKIVNAIFSLIAIFLFVPEMEVRIAPVDGDLEISWNRFLKLYAICLAAPIISVILVLIGLITITFYALVGIAVVIAALIMVVWQMLLLKRSADAFSSYTVRETSPSSRFSPRNSRDTSPISRKPSQAGANEWKCTCGKVNPNFLGLCSCGVRKSEARAAEARRQALAAEKAAKMKEAAAAQAAASGSSENAGEASEAKDE